MGKNEHKAKESQNFQTPLSNKPVVDHFEAIWYMAEQFPYLNRFSSTNTA